MTYIPDINTADAAYTGTITWTAGTAPSGTANHRCYGQKKGGLFIGQVRLDYGTPGVTTQGVTLTLQTGWPSPLIQSGVSGANVTIYAASGGLATAANAVLANNSCAWISLDAAGTGFLLNIKSTSISGSFAIINFSYPI